MQQLAEVQSTEVARPLKVLVPLIKQELQAGNDAGLEHYRRAGEMLIEAKEQIGHGGWAGWLRNNFHLSQQTAASYMKLVEALKLKPRFKFESVRQAVRPSESTNVWSKPVREVVQRVNIERLSAERMDREREAKLIRQLGNQLIDIGYRVLASKLHPDRRDGSAEAMARLNRVRQILKGAL
jgi:hypothetical protein